MTGDPDPAIELIHGSPTITERLFDLSFRVSPNSFFQINSKAAEILYKTAGDLAGLSSDQSVLFDVCCGTGTIGLCLADRCKSVIGVELVADAVEDAKKNAEENGIKNAFFHAGKYCN